MPLDIGIGIFLTLGVAHGFGAEVSPSLLAFGIGAVLLPDIDVLPFFWRVEYDHRSFFHYPLLYIPLAVALFWLLGGLYGMLFSLCVSAHFIHDTIGLGWGIAWFAPFYPRKFLLPDATRRPEQGWYMSWMPEEEQTLAVRYTNPNWVRDYYLRPNTVAYIEYGALVLALIALVINLTAYPPDF